MQRYYIYWNAAKGRVVGAELTFEKTEFRVKLVISLCREKFPGFQISKRFATVWLIQSNISLPSVEIKSMIAIQLCGSTNIRCVYCLAASIRDFAVWMA